MPFTPFHMGPALAFKAVSGRHFSVLTFGIAQVAMDIEPLVGMIRDADVLHGWTHTYFGATLIGLLIGVLAPPISLLILLRWNLELGRHGLEWLGSRASMGWLPAATGAFIGTYSHVAIDSIMHADMAPLWPLNKSNPLLGVISIGDLHAVCAVAGMLGVLAWLASGLLGRRHRRAAMPNRERIDEGEMRQPDALPRRVGLNVLLAAVLAFALVVAVPLDKSRDVAFDSLQWKADRSGCSFFSTAAVRRAMARDLADRLLAQRPTSAQALMILGEPDLAKTQRLWRYSAGTSTMDCLSFDVTFDSNGVAADARLVQH